MGSRYGPESSEQSRTGRARASRLEKATNVAIIVTLLFLLLNPSGVVGRWLGRQVADMRERRAVVSLWNELTDLPGVPGLEQASPDAPIIIEFLDYQCPACKAVAPAVREAMDEGTAIIVFRHLPLEGIHPLAREAAKAVVCAEWQGRLGEAHDALLGDGSWIAQQDWIGLAEAIGIGDLQRFADCLKSGMAETRVDGDVRLAADLGISSTPTFVTLHGVYLGANGLHTALQRTTNSTK